MKIFDIYILFWIYSILGWIMETTLATIKNKKFINRGFFLGPYCPIYGTGGVILLSLSKYKNDLLIVFILSIIICSLVEYLTSYLLELIYRVRWWDYSNNMFNINGRICLFNSICFGLLGMIFVCFLNPFFLNLINSFSDILKNIVLGVLFMFTTLDMVLTFNAMFDFRKTIVNFKEKTLINLFKPNTDNTEEVSQKVRNILKEKTFIHKHLTKSYANFKVYRDYFNKKKDELSKLKGKEKIENRYVISSIMSILIGYVLGNIFNNISLFIILMFVLNLIIEKAIGRIRDGK